MKASVVIPAYNAADYLAEAIESALAQSWHDVQIIVVDDGSTDSTAAVATGYGDRIVYVRQSNQGVAAARNAGLARASGEFVAFLDADDYWMPDFLTLGVGALQEAESKVGLSYCAWRHMDNRGQAFGVPMIGGAEGDLLPLLLQRNICPPHAFVLRRSCIDSIGGFDIRRSGVADWDCWIRAALAGYHFCYVPQELAWYRVLENSMSRDPEHMLQDRLGLIENLFERTDLPSLPRNIDVKMIGQAYLDSSVDRFGSGDKLRAFADLDAAVAADPGLLDRRESWYALLCAEQPVGFKGTQEHLDLERSENRGLEILDRSSFVSSASRDRFRIRRAASCFHATLGLLHYADRALPRARHHLLAAMRLWPRKAVDLSLTGILIRTLLGRKLVDSLATSRRDGRLLRASDGRRAAGGRGR